MSLLLNSFSSGPIRLKNRFVRSATGESRANEEGCLKDTVFPIYKKLADGGVGLIITGHMYVHPLWKCSPRQTGIWDDRHLPGLMRLAEASKINGAHAVAQINYPARPPADLTVEEIVEAANCFVEAGKRAVHAGFDGVQIHAAHGFLLSGFITPSVNIRDDAYGCDAAGRRRLLIEIAGRLRETIGPGKMLLCKLGALDGRDNSLPLDETVATAIALRDAGVDAIEVSCTFAGSYAKPAAENIDNESAEGYFAMAAAEIRRKANITVILVGGLRSLNVMERFVSDGTCDLVSLCRPFIREPDLVNRFAAGTQVRAACISCNKCYNPHGFQCVYNS